MPVNPTARYFGVNGNVVTGVGANFNKNNSIEGDFLWSGLLPALSLVHPINTPTGNVNLFSLTGNYRFHIDRIGDSAFGIYVIPGGGWYYRHISINKNYLVPPLTVCQPVYNWWGYPCDSNGYVQSVTIASHGTSAGGLDAASALRSGLEIWDGSSSSNPAITTPGAITFRRHWYPCRSGFDSINPKADSKRHAETDHPLFRLQRHRSSLVYLDTLFEADLLAL